MLFRSLNGNTSDTVSSFSADAVGMDLTIDTSTVLVDGTGGNVILGDFDSEAGQLVNDVTIVDSGLD